MLEVGTEQNLSFRFRSLSVTIRREGTMSATKTREREPEIETRARPKVRVDVWDVLLVVALLGVVLTAAMGDAADPLAKLNLSVQQGSTKIAAAVLFAALAVRNRR
jgi:hypothetical protein